MELSPDSRKLTFHDDTWGGDPVILEKRNGVHRLKTKGKITWLADFLVHLGTSRPEKWKCVPLPPDYYVEGQFYHWKLNLPGSAVWEWQIRLDNRGEWAGEVSVITFERSCLCGLTYLCSS